MRSLVPFCRAHSMVLGAVEEEELLGWASSPGGIGGGVRVRWWGRVRVPGRRTPGPAHLDSPVFISSVWPLKMLSFCDHRCYCHSAKDNHQQVSAEDGGDPCACPGCVHLEREQVPHAFSLPILGRVRLESEKILSRGQRMPRNGERSQGQEPHGQDWATLSPTWDSDLTAPPANGNRPF